jgi:chromosome segregation protein
MHLRSITLKGFKSFPDRTRLDFSPGVSVVVGPNGSGKSNITDAVLWAMGEQSPLAVRGQSMQDVIFAGGHGVQARSEAEVQVVLDNASGAVDLPAGEISILRKLNRAGEGEYRVNGARCRLTDVLELLSDTGLGKEMHSIVSQGRVEAIVTSKPRDRRLLIEEAAGLGKHRKRRRRAQLKLERTEENLSRALDVEREARSHLRPLKRQAEAAELHERLERQSLEARLQLASDDMRAARAELATAEEKSSAARSERDEAERLLAAVAERREAAEEAFASQSRLREELQGRLFGARSAAERIGIRLERARDQAHAAAERRERRTAQLALLEEQLRPSDQPSDAAGRIAELEQELAGLEQAREGRLSDQLADLESQRVEAERRRDELAETAAARRRDLDAAEEAAEAARTGRREAERAAEEARSRATKAAAELAEIERVLRAAAPTPEGVQALADGIEVSDGYEKALGAVLGPRLAAGIV